MFLEMRTWLVSCLHCMRHKWAEVLHVRPAWHMLSNLRGSNNSLTSSQLRQAS